jgi:hypothetical protein
MGGWLFTSVLEAFELFSNFSSFFTKDASILQMIISLGFASEEMKRRLDLLQQAF